MRITGMVPLLLLALTAATPPPPEPVVLHLGEVTSFSGAFLAVQIRMAVAKKVPSIRLEIDSPGGSAPAGFAIMEALLDAKSQGIPTTCHVTHLAASMAAFILETCQNRTMSADGSILFHEIFVSQMPNNRKLTRALMQDVANDLEDDNQRAAVMVARRMKMSAHQFRQWVSGHERYLDPADALEMNAVDAVLP